jgi:hypothetical protein
MKRTLVRYQAKPEQVQENERLIENVFQELHAKSPNGVRYLALKLGDGTFVHFSMVESNDAGSPIVALDAFRTFQSGIKERCIEPAQFGDVTIVGNYRMLDV